MIIETINAFGDKTKHENVKLMFITQYGLNIDSKYIDGVIERIILNEDGNIVAFDENIKIFAIHAHMKYIIITPEYFIIKYSDGEEKQYTGTILKCYIGV